MINTFDPSVVLILMVEKCITSQPKQKERVKKSCCFPLLNCFTQLCGSDCRRKGYSKKAGQRNVAS